MTMSRLLVALTSVAVIAALATPAASAQSSCATLGGTVDAAAVCTVHSETPSYTIDISFPLDYPDQQAVINYLTQDRGEFVDCFAKFGQNGRDRPYMYDATAKTFRSGAFDSGTQSVVLEIDNDTGAAHQGHPNTTFRAFNYDLGKGAPITIDTLFKPGADPLTVLNPIVQRKWGTHPETRLEVLDASTYRNFAITDDAVTFYFGQDQVVHDNNGPHQISVPRKDLASLLA
jgi:hypothetical protein